MINPHQVQPTSLKSLITSLLKNRQLILQMTKREVVGRYKGSNMGLTWALFNPVLMLAVYTFVFSVVFQSRWGEINSGGKVEFALILFVGIIIFGLFSETISRVPNSILSHTNFVKKVIFPLEILPVIYLGVALFHASISLGVLMIAFFLTYGFINWTTLFFPIIFLPFIFMILGFSWFLASIGVFLRDTGQAIGVITTLMMFLSPVFYPISAVPENLQVFIMLNPLSFIIEQARGVLVFGLLPNWFGLGVYLLAAFLLMMAGYAWFQKTRKGFADVL